MALQVAVDHEHLVAARVGAGPLTNLLVMLLYVLLQGHMALSAQLQVTQHLPPPEGDRAGPEPSCPAPLTFMPSAPRYTAVQPW